MPDHCTILGIPFAVRSRESLYATVRAWLTDPQPAGHIIVTPNPEFCVRAVVDRQFRALLRTADCRLPDGIGLVLAARWLWQTPLRRIAGTDFLFDLCQLVASRRQRLFLVGGSPGIAQRAGENLARLVPGLSVVGAESGDGPDSPGGESGLMDRIRYAKPDVIVVALGAPRQEQWMAAHRPALPFVRVFMGVGGALDYVSGLVPRAPSVLRRFGLEWAYRLWRQPRRMGRIFLATGLFPLLAFGDRVRQLLLSHRVR